MTCVKCECEIVIKYGKRQGKQCYLCKDCGCQFTGDREFIENEKRVAVTLCCFGLSTRKIGELLRYSHVTISNWLRSFEAQEISKEDYVMDIDEMCEFLETRADNPNLGKRFPTIKDALLWTVDNEVSKAIKNAFAKTFGKTKKSDNNGEAITGG